MLFLLQLEGREQERGRGETVSMFKHSRHSGKVIRCHVKALVEAELTTRAFILLNLYCTAPNTVMLPITV